MESLPADSEGIHIMIPKGEFVILKTYDISSPAANILKQQMLSVGGECAVSKFAATCSVDKSTAILIGTHQQFFRLIDSLKYQPFLLNSLAEEIRKVLDSRTNQYLFRIGDATFDFSKKTHIMGILNITPDSFSDGGLYLDPDKATEAAIKMIKEGADIIDIGGESTRPGSEQVDIDTELNRIIPVIDLIHSQVSIPISVDTYKSQVAEEALKHGASLINDISGLTFDSEMSHIISKYHASVALMHIQGTPKIMQENPHYDNLIDEIMRFLENSISLARQAGIEDDQILIDPGFGFGKSYQDNLILLGYLEEFRSLGYPILIGVSRKSFIGKPLNLPANDRLAGSLAAASCGILNGANMVRVHDVKETYRAVRVIDEILGKK